jgi:GTPase SAR1 family protein
MASKKWLKLKKHERTSKAGQEEALSRIKSCRDINSSEIDLSGLKLESIPADIDSLFWIKSINLSDNRLEYIEQVEGLRRLDSINLSNNKIQSLLPLKRLTKLRILNISKNPLKSIKALSNLTNLDSVDLGNTKVDSLRPLKKILEKGLWMRFRPFHPNYRQGISLHECKFNDPPFEIITGGNDALLNYWKEQDRLGTQRAYEGRLIILGEGKVGKTTLLNKLKSPNYQLEKLEQTHGINIWRDWKFPVPDTEEKYSASVWDFGGQDIQHLTHQYFFTPGTVFLLVVNKRGSNAASEATQLNYWFRIIELMGRYSGQKARVMVVHNVFTGDKSSHGINLGPYQEKYKDTLEITFKEVNLAENSGTFDDLRGEIQESLISLPGVGENIIAGWPDIRRKIGERRTERRISFREFGKICEEHDIKTEDSQLLLSRYLARLGELLHYEHGGLLFDNVLLDIDWITTAVYGITENQVIIDRNGRFTREEIIEVWKKNDVTDRGDHELMLQLLQMDAFELCWQTEAGHYLTPTLFSTRRPTGVPPVKANLGLRFHYDYLPKGLLGQLIVRLHKHLEEDHYWKDGIFLLREGCRARISRPLVEKDGERIIEILVEGEAPRHYALLSLIVQELETIHKRSFPRIKFRKEIPCPCERCRSAKWEQAYFSYNQLLQLRRAGDQTATCANQRPSKLKRLLEGMAELEQISPAGFAREVSSLVKQGRTRKALEVLDRQYPSELATLLLSRFSELETEQIEGVLSEEALARANKGIKRDLLKLATRLGKEVTTSAQRTLVAEDPDLNARLEELKAIVSDTNKKVNALGQILLHVGQEVEVMRGDLFESRQEERQFMRKLEETVEQLPAAKQPSEEWYDLEAKPKIKFAIDLLALVPGMSLKWEKEMSTKGAKVPRSWGEFKGWLLR